MSRTPRALTALFAAETIAFAFLAGALLDRHLHQRDPSCGINQWGYREEARGSKQPGEFRVSIIGGSAAFEAGVPFGKTLAAQIFYELRQAGAPNGQEYSVVSLAEPRVGADSYIDTIRDYAFLNPDAVCIFDGYDALSGMPPHGRRRSWVFRATGYLPMLPNLVLGRPAWMSDPDGGIADLLRDDQPDSSDISCGGTSGPYCAAIVETVRLGLRQAPLVIVASPPSVSARHEAQQRSLSVMLTREFGQDPRFQYLDLGAAIDLGDPVHSPDGIHRTEVGNHVVGQQIATAVLQWRAKAPPASLSRRNDGSR
jgi:hypothetical protein